MTRAAGRNAAVIAGVAFNVITLFVCGGCSVTKDPTEERSLAASLVGTWQSEPTLGQLGRSVVKHSFRADGSFSSAVTLIDMEAMARRKGEDFPVLGAEGTYGVKGDQLVLQTPQKATKATFSIDDDVLVLTEPDGDTFRLNRKGPPEGAEEFRRGGKVFMTPPDSPACDAQAKLRLEAQGALERGDLEGTRKLAKALLDVAQGRPREWCYGNSIHHGHRMLGLVALREGSVQEAKAHLLDSGRTEGSPQLSSFGPNMELAKALLERGESEVVIEYFRQCEHFWKDEKLRVWAAQVKAGEVPDFGGNLKY